MMQGLRSIKTFETTDYTGDIFNHLGMLYLKAR